MEKARKISLELMDQRGYTVVDSDDESVTAVTVKGETVICMFLGDVGKINIDCAKTVMGYMSTNNIFHAIIIHTDSITPSARDAFSTTMDMRFEFFHFDELQYNITKHKWVPIHEKLSDVEREEYNEKYGVKIPIIKTTDAVSRFYGFQKGDIIRVLRDTYPVYRIVR